MIQRLRTLERMLVREGAETGVPPVVEDFLHQWDRALERSETPPEPLELPRTLIRSGFHSPTNLRALIYLEKCSNNTSLPDYYDLLSILLPWRPADTPARPPHGSPRN